MLSGISIYWAPVRELMVGDTILDVNGSGFRVHYLSYVPTEDGIRIYGRRPGESDLSVYGTIRFDGSVPVICRPTAARGGLLAKVLDRHRSH